jgi:hypothetical protein
MCHSRLLVGWALASMVIGGSLLVGGGASAQDEIGCGSRTVTLHPGFNLAGYTGPSAELDALAASSGDQFDAAFAWNPTAGSYDAWFSALPANLNALTTLEPGAGLWARSTAAQAAGWEQAVVSDGMSSVSLEESWNLVTWTGPDATSVFAAFEPQSFGAMAAPQSPFVSALGYDNASKRFLTYDPRLPGSLNDLETLDFGDAVWVQMVVGSQWIVPPAGADHPCAGEAGFEQVE